MAARTLRAVRRARAAASYQARAFYLVALLYALLASGAARAAPDAAPLTARPRIEILSPQDGDVVSTPVVKLQVLLRAPPGTAFKLYPLIDGQRRPVIVRGMTVGPAPVLTAADNAEVETVQLLEVPIPHASCTVAVVAESALGSHTSVAVRLNWHPAAGFVIKPKLYLLAVGISTYREGELALRYASKDAANFASAFAVQQGGLYEQVNIRTLLDFQATRDNILDGLQWLQRQTTANDVAILFLAGHGIDDPSSGVYYFVPQDADSTAVMRSMISQQSLQTALRSISGKALLFLDTCHAASVMNGAAGRAVSDVSHLLQELSSVDNGLVVYAAASGRQLSQESSRWENGAFTKAAVEGVLGGAAYHTGRPITAQMLNLYISERVKELTAGAQTPIMVSTHKMADFPLALLPERPAAPAMLPPLMPPPTTLPPTTQPPTTLPTPPPPERFVISGGSEKAPPPFYKRAWFWLTIGGATVALGGLITYAAISNRAPSAPSSTSMPGSTTLTFTKIE